MLLHGALQAQLLNTFFIDSESELDYLFESGQIDPVQFQLLDEFWAVPHFADTGRAMQIIRALENQIHYLQLVPDTANAADDIHEPIALGQYYYRLLQELGIRLSYKTYYNFEDNDLRRQLLTLSGRPAKGCRYYVESEKNRQSADYYFRKRYLHLSSGNLNLRLGNFIPCWGQGITMGYHSGFLDKEKSQTYRSFLYPHIGRYNGISIEYNSMFSPLLVLSYDRSKDARGRLAALGCSYVLENLKIGLLGNYHILENWPANAVCRNLLMGTYLHFTSGNYGFSGEVSENDLKYFAWVLRADRKIEMCRLSLAIWSYHKKYVNPYGAGKANSDYVTIEIEDTGLKYRSPQNGEWGLLMETRCRNNQSSSLDIAANYWCDAGMEKKIRLRVSDRFPIKEDVQGIITYLWGNDNLDLDHGARQHLRFDLIYPNNFGFGFRLALEARRIFYYYGRRDYLRADWKAAISIGQSINLAFKAGRIDYNSAEKSTGYWIFYLNENLILGENAFLRFVLDTKAGGGYDFLNSARANLQLIFTGE